MIPRRMAAHASLRTPPSPTRPRRPTPRRARASSCARSCFMPRERKTATACKRTACRLSRPAVRRASYACFAQGLVQRVAQAIDDRAAAERLDQITDRARLEHLIAHPILRKGGDEYDGNAVALPEKLALQVDAAH